MAKKKAALVDDVEKVIGTKNAFAEDDDEHEESEEKVEDEFASGDKEADPYTEEGREKLEEDDEAKPGEIGYAKGSVGGKRHNK